MGNKVKYNLKNVHAAKLTETVSKGVTTYTYRWGQAALALRKNKIR